MTRLARWRIALAPRSLGAKLALLLGGVGVGGALALALLLSAVITPGFERIERAAVRAQIERTQEAIAALRTERQPARAAALSLILGQPVTITASAAAQPTVVAFGDTLVITVPLHLGTPSAGAAQVSLPRDLSILGRRVLALAVAGAVALLLAVLLALRVGVAALVLAPLRLVERHMTRAGRSGTPAPLVAPARRDEIGSLVDSLNTMLRRFKDLSEQVEVQSFRLGQHENAVAVMHNVRNALNPISTILSHELASTPAGDRALIDRAVAELAEDDVPAERRRKLATFVAAGLAAHTSEQQARAASFAVGRAALNQVLEIVGGQRQGTLEPAPLGPVDLSEVVAQNAAIAQFAGGQSIAFSFPAQPHLARANRVILSQVIGNLLTNAAEAIAAAGIEGGAITATIAERSNAVTLTIRDNGEGFAPKESAALFERGYSSRVHKSGGLGLHWCANAVAAMGGTLHLESGGTGAGACAVLTLPAVQPEAAAA
ncbi:HAMP domain-containing protein [Sphingomonas guangdongensis]|uniref:histidine kinase n=1 Tax=Sphingomonas guangdongensis TaxID=1141890 RepID=A0A285QZP5_9SPHN|nr:HAMP domain-containing sensor histidine kinase [Sphingomonas guangdongensis]SOB86859.1 HAMP domain-containing protein [Sphingomonas guangdongensis]